MLRSGPIALLTLQVICILGCGKPSSGPQGAPSQTSPSPSFELPLTEVFTGQTPAGSVGIMFCLDVSPSMKDPVQGVPKIHSSKAALKTVLRQIEDWAKAPANADKVVKVGLIAFSGKAEIIVPMRTFDRAALEAAVDRVQIGNATAIGDAMVLGSRELLKAGVENKALIVLTDGENNRGVRPELVVQALRNNWNKAGVLTDDVKAFLLAYDIDASIFDGVKQAGAVVLESKDNAGLQRILKETVEEVLLEKPQ